MKKEVELTDIDKEAMMYIRARKKVDDLHKAKKNDRTFN
jgi:hypothetical protein